MIPTGLLGGSFNPAHGAHRAISLFAIERLCLAELWWLVSPGNPLKEADEDMASLPARFGSAKAAARGAPIRVSAIERRFGTRYSHATLKRLAELYPKRRFIWLMGADNLAELHRWRDWRKLAELMPIAVIGRPGYDRHALAAPAMGWLRRFVHRPSQAANWTQWSTPALVILRYRPDPRSATAIRQADPHWHRRFERRVLRDDVTWRKVK